MNFQVGWPGKPARPQTALLATTDKFTGLVPLISAPERHTGSVGRWLGNAFGELWAKPTRTRVSTICAGQGAYTGLFF